MIPTIYAWLSTSSAVDAVLGHDELGLAAFQDEAPQDWEGNFLRWSVVGGQPYNLLGDAPGMDYVRVQFDAFAATQDQAQAIYVAVRNLLEMPYGHVVSFLGTMRDPETRQYRVTWDMSFHVPRVEEEEDDEVSEDTILLPGGQPILLPGGGTLERP